MKNFSTFIKEDLDRAWGKDNLNRHVFNFTSHDGGVSIPIRKGILGLADIKPQRAICYHITSFENVGSLKKLEGKKNAFSVLYTPPDHSRMVNGIEAQGGILAVLEADVLFAGARDLHTFPDQYGNRWTIAYYLILSGLPTYQYKNHNTLIQKIQKAVDKSLYNALAKAFYRFMDKFVKKHSDVFTKAYARQNFNRDLKGNAFNGVVGLLSDIPILIKTKKIEELKIQIYELVSLFERHKIDREWIAELTSEWTKVYIRTCEQWVRKNSEKTSQIIRIVQKKAVRNILKEIDNPIDSYHEVVANKIKIKNCIFSTQNNRDMLSATIRMYSSIVNTPLKENALEYINKNFSDLYNIKDHGHRISLQQKKQLIDLSKAAQEKFEGFVKFIIDNRKKIGIHTDLEFMDVDEYKRYRKLWNRIILV